MEEGIWKGKGHMFNFGYTEFLVSDKPRQHIKSRDITLPTKVCIVKAMVFPVVMYGCENWTIKKAEH